MAVHPERELVMSSQGGLLTGFKGYAAQLNFAAEAYVTLYYGDSNSAAFDGIKVLMHSIRQFDRVRPIVMMTPDIAGAKADPNIKRLQHVLTHIRLMSVPLIRSPRKCAHSSNGKRLSSVFTKFNMWTLTDFSRIIFLEADQFVVQPLTQLWETKLRCTESSELACAAAALTWAPKRPCSTFYRSPWFSNHKFVNTGLMMLRPSSAIFKTLLDGLHNTSFHCEAADQSILNRIMAPRMQCLSYSYNCKADEVPLDDAGVRDFVLANPFSAFAKNDVRDAVMVVTHACTDGKELLPHVIHFLGDAEAAANTTRPYGVVKPWTLKGYIPGEGHPGLRNHSWPYALWYEHLLAMQHSMRSDAPAQLWHQVESYLSQNGRHGPPDHKNLVRVMNKDLAALAQSNGTVSKSNRPISTASPAAQVATQKKAQHNHNAPKRHQAV